MKLAVATLALALVQGGIAKEDATSTSQTTVGQCLTTASANADATQYANGEDQYANGEDAVEWNDKAAYYA